MDSHGGDEYDSPIRRKLGRLFGAFIVRRFIEGDDEMTRTHDRALRRNFADALTDGLDAEFPNAIRRAQSLLVAVDEGHLPDYLHDALEFSDLDQAELKEAIQLWRELCAGPLTTLRLNTDACAYYRYEMSETAQIDYCASVSRTERGLRSSLYRRFFYEASED